MAEWAFHILTFGCKVNQYESQAIREAWTRLGGTEAADPACAHIALVNSCAVTAKGERDARNALYRLRRVAPQAQRILTGCAAQLVAQETQECIDLVVPPRAKALLMQAPRVLVSNGTDALPPSGAVTPFGAQGFCIADFKRARPVVKIQDGCSHRCTYCIVPLMRGPCVSRPRQDIVDEVRHLLEAGFGEVMLSGINLFQYGRDTQTSEDETTNDLWALLRHINHELAPDFAGKARLRISSLDPFSLTSRAMDVLTLGSMFCPHLHLSLQNGSPTVLKNMGRGYFKPEKIIDIVHSLRKTWPHMGLGADILMGFPQEREDDVRMTEALVTELGLNYAHVFPYSPRPETIAATMMGQVPYKEKLDRAARIRARVQQAQREYLQELSTLPELVMVADTPAEDATAPTASAANTVLRGVSEHYAPLRMYLENTPLPAHATTHGFIRVRPVRAEENTLIVQPA